VSVRRVGLRLEARDYASRFKSAAGSDNATARNDLVFSAALYFRKRTASPR